MPAIPSDAPVLVTFRRGFTANWTVVMKLLDIEAKGVRFELTNGGRFRVVPVSALTVADRAFLTANRDEVHAIVTYYSHEEHPQ